MLTILFYNLQHILLVFFALGYRQKSDLSSTPRSTLTTSSHHAHLSTSSLTSQRSQRNFEPHLTKGWSMPRASCAVLCRGFFGSILCQDIVNSKFNRQLFSAYDFHLGTSAHYTLKDFESRPVLNNPLSVPMTCELDPAPTHFFFKN